MTDPGSHTHNNKKIKLMPVSRQPASIVSSTVLHLPNENGFTGPLRILSCDSLSCSLIPILGFQSASMVQRSVEAQWDRNLSVVCIFKKWKDPEVTEHTRCVIMALEKCIPGVTIKVDAAASVDFKTHPVFSIDDHTIDLIICVGGDGTLLHVAAQYQNEKSLGCPPIISFGAGSLGFLTPWKVEDCEEVLSSLLKPRKSFWIQPRCRLSAMFDGVNTPQHHSSSINYLALNEVLIDRGPFATLLTLELYVDGFLVTVVQADGLLVATPTGSTAYSLSAGGGLVAPSVPCILITPISPHSLSFRPLVLPDSCVVSIKVPSSARSRANVAFDGRHAQSLELGETLTVRLSGSPIPTIVPSSDNSCWFTSLVNNLHWNVRTPQKPVGTPLSRTSE